MNTAIHENRASEDYARRVFEKLYPNEAVRTICARLLVDSILLAHSVSSSCWSLTLFSNRVRLNVGPVEVLVFRPNDIFLVIADSEDGRFNNREYRNYIQPSGMYYPSVPINQLLCHIFPQFIEEIYPEISENHQQFIRLAADHKRTTTWKSSFSTGLILYLRSFLESPLPMPAYYKPNATQDQSLSPDQINTETTMLNYLEGNASHNTLAPKETQLKNQWDNELKNWINKSRNIKENLASLYIRFFTLAFENTSCPNRAWFGVHDLQVSLVVGSIFLAAIIKSGKDKGVWLLLKDPPVIEGWQSWKTLSTQISSNPLQWFHTSDFSKVVDVLDNSVIWQSYQIASDQILGFPLVATDRDTIQKRRGKLRLSEIYTPSISPLKDIELYRSSYENLQDTERQAIIQSRIGQGKFRADLIQYWGKCAVTGCQKVDILRASHIKPWSKSNNQERLDVYNGLLLIPNLDVAFDAGFISFDEDGKIIISRYLTEDAQNTLGIHPELRLSRLAEQNIKYLQYHRSYRFKGI